MDSLKQFFNWHGQTLVQVGKLVPVWVYLLPVLIMLVLAALDQTPLAPYLIKESAEIIAPIILLAALLVAIWRMFRDDHVFFKWLAFFALILFFRELHFYGTNNGFYIGFILMMWWASANRERMNPYFSSRYIVSLVVLLIWVYLISKSFDRHMWDNLLPQNLASDLFEENLEISGHLLFLLLTVTCTKKRA